MIRVRVICHSCGRNYNHEEEIPVDCEHCGHYDISISFRLADLSDLGYDALQDVVDDSWFIPKDEQLVFES